MYADRKDRNPNNLNILDRMGGQRLNQHKIQFFVEITPKSDLIAESFSCFKEKHVSTFYFRVIAEYVAEKIATSLIERAMNKVESLQE